MALTGKSTLSLRKRDVLEQKQAGAAYKRLVFAHKATLGDTGIDLTALSQPPEMASLGFTNPTTQDILAAKILFHKKNLTIVSSAKGVLIQDLSYTVPTSERIAFQGFTAEDGEIFTITLESSVKDGLQVVDSTPIVASGILPAGQTTFNVGVPFPVGKHITQQAGAVLVFLDGVQQFRNSINSDSVLDANYYEVDAGNGLGNQIEFNTADAINDRSVLVVSNGAFMERPVGSQMAVVESLAGQVDKIIPVLSAVSGQPESYFQGAPNNVDLKAFGDLLQSILDTEVPIVSDLGVQAWADDQANATTSAKLTRVGNRIFVDGTVSYTGAQSGTLNITIPANYAPDSTFYSNLSALNRVIVGGGAFIKPATNHFYASAELTSLTNLKIMAENVSGSLNFATDIGATTPFTWASGDYIKFSASWVVQGWSATETIRQKLGL